MTQKATRLHPPPLHELPAHRIYEDLELPPPGVADFNRPYVILNMVSSVDGKFSIDGKAARIGSRIDRQTMRNLRSHADAVMIGANTLRAERLSLGVDEPTDGPQPLAIIATTSGDVPLESNLILAQGQDVLLLCALSAAGDHSAIDEKSGDLDLEHALQILKAERGVDVLLVEGGPTLNHALISRGLADELFLTLAPIVVVGDTLSETRAVLGVASAQQQISTSHLLSVHLADDELFLRYTLRV